jgi:3D-(3,5/4)-trihydroxycyclohexane-1,2-dione acylhydrolase (decyclizing)
MPAERFPALTLPPRYRANTVEELKAALEDAKTQDVSTLIEMKVLPKTMTDGYDF